MVCCSAKLANASPATNERVFAIRNPALRFPQYTQSRIAYSEVHTRRVAICLLPSFTKYLNLLVVGA